MHVEIRDPDDKIILSKVSDKKTQCYIYLASSPTLFNLSQREEFLHRVKIILLRGFAAETSHSVMIKIHISAKVLVIRR